MKLVVTAFEPFGEDDSNASWEALCALPQSLQGVELYPVKLPVSMETSLSILHEVLRSQDPDVILSIGQAKGRAAISVERVGINVDDFRIADNDGNVVHEKAIFADGQDAYFSNLPLSSIVSEINKRGIKAEISNTAGTYICNHVLYGVRYMIEHEFPRKRSGFLHVPCLKRQVKEGTPYMELEDIVRAITIAIEVIAKQWQEEQNRGR